MKTTYSLFLAAALTAGIAGCASAPQKADLAANTDPQAKLTELRDRQKADLAKQVDVLSPANYQAAAKYLDQAQQGIAKADRNEKVLDDEANAMARLNIAEANTAKHTDELAPVLTARKAALDAQAAKMMPEDLASSDDTLSGWGKDIESNSYHADPSEISKLQAKYSDTELKSVKKAKLGNDYAILEKAKDRDAESKAPQTLAEARMKYDSALRAVEANRRDASSYQPAVDAADKSAHKLDFVLNTIGSSNTSEMAAVKIYDQQEQLASAKDSLQKSQAEIDQEKTQMDAQQKNLSALQSSNDQYAQRDAANAKIEAAKAEFTPSEADVYRDGSKIILRLKNMKFSSSHYDLTQSSIGTLQKVKDMIAATTFSKVEVEGHTDNIGGEAKNEALSQKRADSVKDFLVEEKSVPAGKIEAKGYGYEKPLTSNKTAAGRATNRRVDIVIDTGTEAGGTAAPAPGAGMKDAPANQSAPTSANPNPNG